MAPADPILGVTEAFVADQNPKKVNLGVGVYTDDSGRIPLLECVRRAEELRLKNSPHRGYLPIDGLAATIRPCRLWCSVLRKRTSSRCRRSMGPAA